MLEIYINMYIYMYINREREREGEKEGDREREREGNGDFLRSSEGAGDYQGPLATRFIFSSTFTKAFYIFSRHLPPGRGGLLKLW